MNLNLKRRILKLNGKNISHITNNKLLINFKINKFNLTSVTQLVEYITFNDRVLSSSLSGSTYKIQII